MHGLNFRITLKIILLIFVVYSLVLIPPGLVFKYVIFPLFSKNICSFFLGVVLFLGDFWVLLITAITLPGICWRILKLRYSGFHPLDLSNKDVCHWLLTLVLYLPAAVILDFFHFYPLKTFHIRLFGGKIGENVVLGGLVLDPSLLYIGDSSVIGGFSTIQGHSVERGKIFFGKVTIGKDCGVGIRATILPGSILEDGSLLGAQSLLLKNSKIPINGTFGGVPARNLHK